MATARFAKRRVLLTTDLQTQIGNGAPPASLPGLHQRVERHSILSLVLSPFPAIRFRPMVTSLGVDALESEERPLPRTTESTNLQIATSLEITCNSFFVLVSKFLAAASDNGYCGCTLCVNTARRSVNHEQCTSSLHCIRFPNKAVRDRFPNPAQNDYMSQRISKLLTWPKHDRRNWHTYIRFFARSAPWTPAQKLNPALIKFTPWEMSRALPG